jgi:hypothetical protein
MALWQRVDVLNHEALLGGGGADPSADAAQAVGDAEFGLGVGLGAVRDDVLLSGT